MAEGNSKLRLIAYFKKNLKKGYPAETLRYALIGQGYIRPTIDEAMKDAMIELAKEVPVIKEKPRIEHEIIVDNQPPIVVKKSWLKKLFGLD